MSERTLHIAMFPWLAMGHLTPFLHISNKLAQRGHKISFFVPLKTQSKLQHFNLHPHLITFIPINVPHVEGLPPGTETTADIDSSMVSLLATSMDLTRPQIQQVLIQLKPDFVFFDFSHWLPALLAQVGADAKSIYYSVINPACVWYGLSRFLQTRENQLEDEAGDHCSSFSIKLRTYEAQAIDAMMKREYGREGKFVDRLISALRNSDALCLQSCRELAGPYPKYIEILMNKPVIFAGPVIPVAPSSQLEEKWARWLGGFEPSTVIFCALGSEYILTTEGLQQLLLGFELTGLPFFAALKPPTGVESIESALPDGFEERVKGRGVVYGGWVQQPLILNHPSVGCFVTHCGTGSLNEGLLSKCNLVFLTNIIDQVVNARMMSSGDLKVGIEIEIGDEDGLFTKECVCEAVKTVMDEDSEVGKELKTNHAKWREFLSGEGLESSYIDGLEHKLYEMQG